jgi:hypothetical protein
MQCDFPALSLGYANYVKDYEKRHKKRGNQAQRRNRHSDHGNTVRIEQRGRSAKANGGDQVGDAEKLPQNERFAVDWITKLPRHEGSGGADGHVAVACGQCKGRWENGVGFQKDEHESQESPRIAQRSISLS